MNLDGNNELRQLFAGQPNMAGWLDEREARIRGIDAPQAPAPQGMDPGFYQAMLSAGAAPHAPERHVEAPQALSAPQQPPAPVSLPPSAPAFPPMLQPLLQQAPVMSQASPAPAAPAIANINNNVTMPQQTFTPATPRRSLPTTQAQNLAPNLGAYAPAPQMPGYGMPRTGSPFRPAAPQGLPTFANFGGLNPAYSPQPIMQEPDGGFSGSLASIVNGSRNLFNRY